MKTLEHINCSTPDFAKENVAKLLALFPECAGEQGEVDFDKLRQTLSSSVIEGNVERYEFTWPGKRAAKAAASAATTMTLRPCVAESVGRDGTPGGFDSENLYIEGDNLEVLKLLQTSYANQVKMIYIDPPYNTGHDFVYRDRFSMTDKELATVGGAISDENCGGGGVLAINDSAEARYHSNWCSMMYPRLKLARNLLRDDGVIFISIDYNENARMRVLLDEVFGSMNFVGEIYWESKTKSQNTKGSFNKLQPKCEMIFVYTKKNKRRFNLVGLGLKEYPFEDENGVYREYVVEQMGANDTRGRETMIFPMSVGGETITPDDGKQWKIGRDTYNEYKKQGDLFIREHKPIVKMRPEYERTEKTEPFWGFFDKKIGTAESAKKDLTELIGRHGFDTVKPMNLIKRLALHATEVDDIVLDFFSGSATTAHAVMQLNAEDGGNRKFIMVQIPEVCAEGSEAATAGYKNICEIGKERIRKAGTKITEENATTAPNLDIGFRVLKLDSSSLNDTSATVSETTQEFENFDRIKSDRSAEDLLFQMLLETRIPLSEPICKSKVAGNDVFFVGATADAQDKDALSGAPLVACLDHGAKMDSDFFIEIAKLKPGIAFFRDDAFADDSARTNVQQAFDQFSPTTSIKVI